MGYTPYQHPMSGPRRGTTPPSNPKTVPANNPTPPPQGVPPTAGAIAGAAASAGAMSVPPSPATPAAPAPSPVQPISYNGGSYNPTTAPFGFDMSMPGVQEQMWANNQDMWFDTPQLDWANSQLPGFSDPWSGEQAISASMGNGGSNYGAQYWEGMNGGKNTENYSKTAFDRMEDALPQSFQPQFDAYYDRMKDKVMSDANAQSAARGAYGSSSALNGTIGAGLDTEAERAKASTDFMFKDSDNRRAWLDMYGKQGRAADLTGIDQTKTLAEIAFRADDTELARDKFGLDQAETLDELKRNRMDSGISTAFGLDNRYDSRMEGAFKAAGSAQDQRDDRVNTLQGQLSSFSNDVQDYFQENYDALMAADEGSIDDLISTMVAQTADQRGFDQQQQERMMRDLKTAWDMIKGKQANTAAGG